MAQHDYLISDASGIAFLADLNVAMAAVVSGNSGNSAPSTTYPYMVWNDTLNGVKKERNASNTAWVVIGALSTTNLGLASLAGATFTGPVSLPTGSTVAGYVPTASAGMRNLLINGNPVINQRGYVSGTATTTAFQYTLDRWFVFTSGQSIVYSDSGGIRTLTAPAGGIGQVIEGACIVITGAYALSWVGTATATVNGTAVTNGIPFTLTSGVSVTVKFSNGSVSRMQLEPGSVATQFEQRPGGLELVLCQRYYQNPVYFSIGGATSGAPVLSGQANLPVIMRTTPSLINTSLALSGSATGVTFTAYASAVDFAVTTTSGTAGGAAGNIALSAEL